MGKLKEAGRKISASNKDKIKAAIAALLELVDDQKSEDAQTQTEAAHQGNLGEAEATTKTTKPAVGPSALSIAAVRKHLQALIDLLSPDAKENLEGDGDGDNDKDSVLLQGRVGEWLQGDTDEAAHPLPANLVEALYQIYERQFDTAKRVELAKKGWAIPVKNKDGEVVDGRYPIETKEDLSAAKKRIGTGSDDDKADIIAHINKQADRLGEPKVYEKAKAKESKVNIPLAPWIKGAVEEAKPQAAGMVCAGCKTPVKNSYDSYCANCGNALRGSKKSGYCSGCGSSMDSADKFCPSCGTKAQTGMDESSNGSGNTDGGGNGQLILDTGFVPLKLTEKAIGRDGTIAIKMIRPGWGSSGHYSKDVLETKMAKAFPSGTKMYWNHPTALEEDERPERDLRDLAAVTVSDPKFLEDGSDGPGLYTFAKPFKQYTEAIEELAPHIGVSIRAIGAGRYGEAEGRKGNIVEDVVEGRSIDFVTEPGAGGAILPLFESARKKAWDAVETAPKALPKPTPTPKQEDNSVDLDEALKRIKALEAENNKLRERNLLREAKEFVAAELDNHEGVFVPTKMRLREELSLNPPVDEDGELDKKKFRAIVKEAVRKESEYLEAVIGGTGSPRGMGNTPRFGDEDEDDEDGTDEEFNIFSEAARGRKIARESDKLDLTAQFKRLGLDDKIAEGAARGR